MARAKRPATPGDMVRTLLLLLIPVAIIYALFSRDLDDYPVQVVDWRGPLATARAEAPYPVLAPVSLPDTWRATRVEWVAQGDPYRDGPSVRNMWRLGFLDPDDVFVGLVQGDSEPEDLIARETREGASDGQSVVNGQTWTRYVSSDGRTRSLVLSEPAVTSIVSGDLTYPGLEAYAGTLSSTG